MSEISKERRAFLREGIEGEPDGRNLSGWGLAVSIGELRALLEAADERDRLREEADRVRALAEQLNVALRDGSADLSGGWACERW